MTLQEANKILEWYKKLPRYRNFIIKKQKEYDSPRLNLL